MNAKLRWAAVVLLVLALLWDLALWGGIASTPEVAPAALRSAGKEAPMALGYMHAGRLLVDGSGAHGFAQQFASRRVGHAYPAVQSRPEAAMDILLEAMPAMTRAAHSSPPALLLAWSLLWLLRPRQVQTLRRK